MFNATTGHELFSFIYAYSGYNQIKMQTPDEDKIAFTTGRAIYCYNVMPFGLRNIRATFQQMINQIFKELIENTIEVYVLSEGSRAQKHVFLNQYFKYVLWLP